MKDSIPVNELVSFLLSESTESPTDTQLSILMKQELSYREWCIKNTASRVGKLLEKDEEKDERS